MPERTSAAGTPGEELAETLTAALDGRLAAADAALVRQFPGDAPDRQPVHTVYVPADRFTDGLAADWGRAALAAIDEHPTTFAGLTGDPALVELVRDKLGREPIEDVRIDFEDGYGARGDDAEDDDVRRTAAALAAMAGSGAVPPFRGIRFKSLEAPTRRRGIRTLTLFLTELLERGGDLARLRGDAAQDHQRRPGRGDGRADGSPRGRTRPRRDQPPVRAADRDPAVDPRAGRHRARRPDDPRGRRPGAPPCTTAPTTTPRSAASRPRTRAWSTRWPTTPSW